ncbi:hypothetical protein FQA39_LY06477 [Lamprigera yunnana]|nr:hypothetical protein FQA39_LY06477 [Lamprigera yunnana]
MTKVVFSKIIREFGKNHGPVDDEVHKGDRITNMACEDIHLNDCQLANNIQYCYCNRNLCNGNTSIKKSVTNSPGLNDDEDFTEGSGFKIVTSTNSETIDTSSFKPTELTPSTGECLHSTFVVIAAAILLL